MYWLNSLSVIHGLYIVCITKCSGDCSTVVFIDQHMISVRLVIVHRELYCKIMWQLLQQITSFILKTANIEQYATTIQYLMYCMSCICSVRYSLHFLFTSSCVLCLIRYGGINFVSFNPLCSVMSLNPVLAHIIVLI